MLVSIFSAIIVYYLVVVYLWNVGPGCRDGACSWNFEGTRILPRGTLEHYQNSDWKIGDCACLKNWIKSSLSKIHSKILDCICHERSLRVCLSWFFKHSYLFVACVITHLECFRVQKVIHSLGPLATIAMQCIASATYI